MHIIHIVKKRNALVAFALIFALVVVGFIYCTADYKLKEGQLYRVSKVIDGDTFVIKIYRKEYTIRLLGIDSPETVHPKKAPQCYGPEASAELKRLLIGQEITLEFNPERELFDKYGRYLAYVHVASGSLVNIHMVENGFAREYTFGTPYSRQNEFREAQDTAKIEKRGLWLYCSDL